MLRTLKKPLSFVMALFMCLTMFTGIILPEIAEAPTANAVADPYAAVAEKMTLLDKANGQVTAPGTGTKVDIPEEYLDMDIYAPKDDRVFFFSDDWTAAGLGVSAIGDYFILRYGDGSKWGNGKVYLMQWGINAFGEKNLYPYTNPDDEDEMYETDAGTAGSQLFAAGAVSSGWADILEITRHTTPVIGQDNSFDVVVFPCTMDNSTGVKGNYNGVTFKKPELNDTVTAESELTAADYTSLNIYGPQAGKSPTVGVVGDTTVANNRSTNAEYEAVFSSTFWLPVNATWNYDGIAMSGSTKMHLGAQTTRNAVSGLTLKNVYAEQTDGGNRIFQIGGNSQANNKTAVRLHISDSYFTASVANTAGAQYMQVNDLKFDNVVMAGITYDVTQAHTGAIYPNACNNEADDTAFLGTYRNSWNQEYNKCTFHTDVQNMFIPYTKNLYAAGGQTGAKFSVSNGSFKGFTHGFIYMADGSSTNNLFNFSFSMTGNYVETPRGATDSHNVTVVNTNGGNNWVSGKTITFDGNTFVGTPGATYNLLDINSIGLLCDFSGNLFMTHDGQIRVPRASWISEDTYSANGKVVTDFYASSNKDYGVRDLFIPQQADQDLLITHAYIQAVLRAGNKYHTKFGTDIVSAVTVFPEDGVTYDASNLFTFRNPDVKYVGTFSDEACTTPVTTYKMGDGTRYGKAVYETGCTKATVVYIIEEPVGGTGNTLVVAPNGETEYAFNGTTYNSSNATFYSSIAAAVSAYTTFKNGIAADADLPKQPTDIILVMPGTYNESFTVNKAMAIVGPDFGKSGDPTVDKSKKVGNARGTGSGEAVVTGTINVAMPTTDYAAYYCLAGISNTATGNPLVVKTTASAQQQFINLQNLYINATGQVIITPKGGDENNNGVGNRTKLYANNCFVTGTTANSYQIIAQLEFAHWNKCTMIPSEVGTGVTNGKPNGAYSWRPVDPTVTRIAPYASGTKVTDSTIADSNGKWYNLTQQRYHTDQEIFANNPTRHLFIGNTFVGNTAYLFETYAESAKPIKYTDILIKNNYIELSKTEENGIINDSTTRKKGDAGDLVIEGNVIRGYAQPIKKNSNFLFEKKVDINENFFGTADGKVRAITCNESYFDFDSSWYYANEEMTVKTTDIAPTKGGFAAVEVTDPIGYTADLFGTAGETYNLDAFSVNSRRATVTGLFTDPACEHSISSIAFDGTDTVVYMRVKMDNYVAVWTITVKVADVWSEKGLTIQSAIDTGNYVDMTAQANYAARKGGNTGVIAFVSHDWTRWAHLSYDGTTLSDPVITNLNGLGNFNDAITGATFNEDVVEASTDSAVANDIFRELKVGTVFYAQMPTTGVVYKLTYGVTAVNMRQFNTRKAATVVLFPGYYNKTTGYSSGDTAGNTIRSNAPVNGSFAIGGTEVNTDIKDFVVLGPQAGIPAGNSETGVLRDSSAAVHHYSSNKVDGEAQFATSAQLYWIGGAMKDGGSLTVDGIQGSWGYNINTTLGSGGNRVKNAIKLTLNLNNCKFSGWDHGGTFLKLYANDASVSDQESVNLTKADMTLNMHGTAVIADNKAQNQTWAKTNLNKIHLTDCVFKNPSVNTTDMPIFYTAPVTGAKNATKTDISYTADNCYIDWNGGYLFGIYMNATSKISSTTRNKFEIKLTNNYVEDMGFASNETRTALATVFDNGMTEAEVLAINDITKITMTHNVIKNTTGAYPGTSKGAILYKQASAYPVGATITDNIFIGYNNLFKGIEGDFYNNIYQDIEGKYISLRGWGNNLTTSDIVLNDTFTRWATDFDVKAGINLLAPLSWTPGQADIHARAAIMQRGTTTAAHLKGGMLFESDEVVVDGLYAEDGITKIGDSTLLEVGKTYRLVACYADDPSGARAVYEVKVDGVFGTTTPLYEGSNKYYDPDVANIDKGTPVVRNVDGTDYQFIVGKNILGTLEEFPIYEVDNYSTGVNYVRKVHLFAKTYFDGEDIHLPDSKIGAGYITEFYGAKAGVSAVAYDPKGAPNGERSAARTDMSKETIITNAMIRGMVKLDGITLADAVGFWYGDIRSDAELNTVINCQSHPDAKLTTYTSNKIFSFNTIRKTKLVVHDNYFDSAETMSGAYFTLRNPDVVDVHNNVFKSDASINIFWASLLSSDSSWDSDASNTTVDIDVYNNYSTCRVNIEGLRTVNVSKGIKTNVAIRENYFVLDDSAGPIYFGSYTPAEKTTTTYGNLAMDGKNTTVEIVDNTFTSTLTGGPHYSYIYHAESETLNIGGATPYKLFKIEGNTFYNSPDGSVGSVFDNRTDYVWDVSRNTYVGFEHAYGNVDPDKEGKLNIQRISMVARSEQYDMVKFSGLGEAKFEIGETVFGADDVAEGLTVADVTASDVAAEEGNILTDVATGNSGWTYVFSGKKGMNVKITDAEGGVHYNAINISKDNGRTEAKVTFTAQLITLAGTPVGEEFTVTAYAEPVGLIMDADDCTVIQNGANASFHWEGYFRGKHATYVTDLINKTGFKVTGYGVYTGATEEDMADHLIATNASKHAIAENADGLDTVNLDFAVEYNETLPATTEARYGRLYMTYKVGNVEYMVLSKTTALTVYVAD